MLSRLSRSLSFRLLVIFLLLGGLFVFGTLKAIQRVYNSDEIRGLISGHLSLHVQYVRDDIGTPPRIERALAITERVPVDIRIKGPGFDWASDPAFPMVAELDFGPSPKFGDDPSAWVDELRGVEFASADHHKFLKISQGVYDIVVSSPRISDVSSGIGLINVILLQGLSLLLIGYLAVNWLFKPIREIRAGTNRIGRGNFNHRIEKTRHDQLGDLARDINQLAGDVESMLDAKRALLLGISHELRTPLSRMRLGLEFVDDEEQAASLRSEIDEMEKIVVTLLEAERLNVRHAQLARTEVRIADLVDTLLEDFFSRERERIKVSGPDDEETVSVDEARVSLLLKNLLSNALRYADDSGGAIEVAYAIDDGALVLSVQDNGPGISDEQIEHLGEPFYRPDPSRTRSSGGTGLGLYLATLVARAHGGTLKVVNRAAPGTCIEARIALR